MRIIFCRIALLFAAPFVVCWSDRGWCFFLNLRQNLAGALIPRKTIWTNRIKSNRIEALHGFVQWVGRYDLSGAAMRRQILARQRRVRGGGGVETYRHFEVAVSSTRVLVRSVRTEIAQKPTCCHPELFLLWRSRNLL